MKRRASSMSEVVLATNPDSGPSVVDGRETTGQPIGARRSAHGRARSNAALARKTVASSSRRPTI